MKKSVSALSLSMSSTSSSDGTGSQQVLASEDVENMDVHEQQDNEDIKPCEQERLLEVTGSASSLSDPIDIPTTGRRRRTFHRWKNT